MAKSHFVLVHGACHGAWCWYKVATLLKSGGHKVTALDLAASGVNPMQVSQVRTVSEYNQPLMDFMEGLATDQRVVLVGHSLGALSVTRAMETFPHKISLAVFAGAAATTLPSPDSPSPSRKLEFVKRLDFMDSEYRYDDGPDNPRTSTLLGPRCLATWYYQQCSPEDLTLGQLLVRPCPTRRAEVTVTKENYGSVHRVFVAGKEDLLIQNWIRTIESNQTDEVELIAGADHMIMLSRPLELSSYLQNIACKYS